MRSAIDTNEVRNYEYNPASPLVKITSRSGGHPIWGANINHVTSMVYNSQKQVITMFTDCMNQCFRIGRLCDVSLESGVQSFSPVFHACIRSESNRREEWKRLRVHGANSLNEIEAIHSGHANI